MQTPEVLAVLYRAAIALDIPFDRLIVGNAMNHINPVTGAPEFSSTDDDTMGPFENAPQGVPDLNIDVPGGAQPYTPPSDPSMGTARLPTGLAPSSQGSRGTGMGALPPRLSEYAPRLDPLRGPMPFPGGTDLNGGAYRDDFNPLRNYPVPGYTNLTPRRQEIGQGSGSFEDRQIYDEQGHLVPNGHYGVDFAVPAGTPVLATGDCKVSNVSEQRGYGNQVTIKHANGFTTLSGHLESVHVMPGDTVKAGDVIGTSGATGNAKGRDPQVHYEVRGSLGGIGNVPGRNGIIYNPLNYLSRLNPRGQ